MTGRLTGKSVLISGAARGQGACEAELFVHEGARVVLGDVMDDEVQAVADDIGASHPGAAVAVHLDVTSSDDWVAAVGAVVSHFGGLHVLVNNAGITSERFGGLVDIEDMTLEAWNGLLAVNLTGTFLGMRSVIPTMR